MALAVSKTTFKSQMQASPNCEARYRTCSRPERRRLASALDPEFMCGGSKRDAADWHARRPYEAGGRSLRRLAGVSFQEAVCPPSGTIERERERERACPANCTLGQLALV